KGVLLSEGRGISTLIDECMVDNQKEAGQIAAKAGVDVGISMEDAYLSDLITSVREGMVPMQVIDRAVRRILRLKFMLGLFENAAVDVERAVSTVHCQSHRDLALQAAREGIVLLKNENGLLPLQKDIKTIAVIGPNADASRDQLGDYSPFHIITDIVTVLDGIKKKVSPDTRIIHVKGCEIQGIKHNEIDKAKQAAQEADIAVVVVGESRNTDGEGRDVGDLNLTGLQQALVQAVCATGTPTVVVLINGRPLSTVWTAENADAVVEAWNCGERGGEAVADVLFGDYNPSGRLSITIPRHVGQLPVYYNHSPSKKGKVYRNLDAKPLYEFGYGLSYTEFTYSNLTMSSRNIGIADTIQISVDVKNSGQRPGEEVVQLYVNDVLSSVTTPIMDLRAFKKIKLEPDQSKTVRFTLMPEHLMLLDRNLRWTVEPGEFVVMIGHSSQDIRLKDRFNVTR
ncbi:MAG: glycoside hydrolase family 3 C-terminal domain-containing protein, partial [Sedimentisphaerales bacterium]|nr:glycoside hydrolase family 3 C-terminal domain-containing protein [Sedimentisphaerales bacterium]